MCGDLLEQRVDPLLTDSGKLLQLALALGGLASGRTKGLHEIVVHLFSCASMR